MTLKKDLKKCNSPRGKSFCDNDKRPFRSVMVKFYLIFFSCKEEGGECELAERSLSESSILC